MQWVHERGGAATRSSRGICEYMAAWVCPDRSPIPPLLTWTYVPDAVANPPELLGGLDQQLLEGGGVATRSPKGICELLATWVCPDRSPIPPLPAMTYEVAAPTPNPFAAFLTFGLQESLRRLLCILFIISGHCVRWHVLPKYARPCIINILLLAFWTWCDRAAYHSAASAWIFCFVDSCFCPFPSPASFSF